MQINIYKNSKYILWINQCKEGLIFLSSCKVENTYVLKPCIFKTFHKTRRKQSKEATKIYYSRCTLIYPYADTARTKGSVISLDLASILSSAPLAKLICSSIPFILLAGAVSAPIREKLITIFFLKTEESGHSLNDAVSVSEWTCILRQMEMPFRRIPGKYGLTMSMWGKTYVKCKRKADTGRTFPVCLHLNCLFYSFPRNPRCTRCTSKSNVDEPHLFTGKVVKVASLQWRLCRWGKKINWIKLCFFPKVVSTIFSLLKCLPFYCVFWISVNDI